MKRAAVGHTKMFKLIRYLRIPRYQAIGILESLWHLAAREAVTGNIGRLSNEDIAIGIDYEGDPDALVKALTDAGWLDPSEEHRLVIHDWHEHADDSVKKHISRNGLKFADIVASCPSVSGNVETSSDMVRLPEPMPEPECTVLPTSSCSSVHSGVTEHTPHSADAEFGAPDPAPPKAGRTPRKPVVLTEEQEGWFAKLWAEYWRHDAKGAGRKAFGSHVKTRETANAFWQYIQRNKADMLANDVKYRPHFSTVVNQERWNDDANPQPVAVARANGNGHATPIDREALRYERQEATFNLLAAREAEKLAAKQN